MSKVPLVLHVDDSKMILAVVKEIVSIELKCNLLQASTGEECIALAKDKKPDIIFVDAVMEPMDGWKVAQELKKISKTKDIPVVMVTGESRQDEIDFAYSIGVKDYIVKPPTKAKMLRKMVKLLGEDIFKDMGVDTSCCTAQESVAQPVAAPVFTPAPVAAAPAASYCAGCKGFMTWVPGQGWYCYKCQKYADPQPAAPVMKKFCPGCAKEMTYLFDQTKWYCFACQK